MKQKHRLTALTIGVCLSACILGMADSPQKTTVGYINAVKGKAYLLPRGSQKPILLNPDRHKFHPLHPGDKLRCDKNSQLVIRLYDGQTRIMPSKQWFVVPSPPPRNDRVLKALNAYGRTAGRTRDPYYGWVRVISPASVQETLEPPPRVLPHKVVIRWLPPDEATGTLTIELRAPNGAQLWREENVPIAAGELDSPQLRNALQQYREQSGASALQLKLTSQEGGAVVVRFALLSREQEKQLEQELEAWASEKDPLMRRIGRAYVYEQFRLWSEVAEEYEHALKLAPQSEHLLELTIWAQSRLGNRKRVRELIR